jgi:hypothetical protein
MKFINANNSIFNGWVYCLVSVPSPDYSCLMDFKGHVTDASASLIREIWICARSTAVKFGIPFGPVLKHGPRSLSSTRVNEYVKLICRKNLTVYGTTSRIRVRLLNPGVFLSTYAAMYMENIP